MSLNPLKLSKEMLQKYITGRCIHRHRYTEHPECFVREQGAEKRVGYLDIECSGLYPFFGVMGSYCIKPRDEEEILGRKITQKELRSPDMDKQLVKDCIADMKKFDILVTYYGAKFDIPFIRTQALAHNLDEFIPVWGQIKHIDVYYIVKFKLRMQRRSLDAVTRLLGIPGKTHVEGSLWKKAFMHADMDCMQEIFEHNQEDVRVLEKVHKRLENFCSDRSVTI